MKAKNCLKKRIVLIVLLSLPLLLQMKCRIFDIRGTWTIQAVYGAQYNGAPFSFQVTFSGVTDHGTTVCYDLHGGQLTWTGTYSVTGEDDVKFDLQKTTTHEKDIYTFSGQFLDERRIEGKADYYEPYGEEPGLSFPGIFNWTATKD